MRPGAVTARVFNAAGTPGLGARAAADLTARGFRVPEPAGDRGTGATATVVRYGPDKADSARTLAAAVPAATLLLAPDLGSTLELLVGSDYQGAVAVTLNAPAAADPAAAAPLTTAADDGCVR